MHEFKKNISTNILNKSVQSEEISSDRTLK